MVDELMMIERARLKLLRSQLDMMETLAGHDLSGYVCPPQTLEGLFYDDRERGL
jgi:hypothetical protein